MFNKRKELFSNTANLIDMLNKLPPSQQPTAKPLKPGKARSFTQLRGFASTTHFSKGRQASNKSLGKTHSKPRTFVPPALKLEDGLYGSVMGQVKRQKLAQSQNYSFEDVLSKAVEGLGFIGLMSANCKTSEGRALSMLCEMSLNSLEVFFRQMESRRKEGTRADSELIALAGERASLLQRLAGVSES